MRADLLKRIHLTFTNAVQRPEMEARYKNLFMLQLTSVSPVAFKKFIDTRIDEYRVVAERAKIKVDD